jgi:hypothetical protein|tara:strand:- start:482 stop:736 length:255 start_codon:yes stop_codon:yes gene_type:complete
VSSLGGLFLYMSRLDKALKDVGGKRTQNYRLNHPAKYLKGSQDEEKAAKEMTETAKRYNEGTLTNAYIEEVEDYRKKDKKKRNA